MTHKCFLVEPTGKWMLSLRRYTSNTVTERANCPKMPGEYSYHQALFRIGEVELVTEPCEHEHCKERGHLEVAESARFRDDAPEWPMQCACGFAFAPSVTHQHFTERMYWNPTTGDKWTMAELPVGAMWFDDWLPKNFWWDNFDGRHLHVKLPNGREWNIDSRCSNCTLPNDRTHRCWVRHGEPPNVHVDKNGHTCSAGAGSIVAGSYHGFLHNGELREC
jgi:hypothetical protein